jgi:hypothetical protein
MKFGAPLLWLVLLAPLPAGAQIQSDCRAPGNVGTAVMSADGTITLTLLSPDGAQRVLAYHKGDPQYARILSHIGGIQLGEHKPVPAFCHS